LPPVTRKKRRGRRPRKGKRLPAPVELAKHIEKWTSVGTNERAKDRLGLDVEDLETRHANLE